MPGTFLPEEKGGDRGERKMDLSFIKRGGAEGQGDSCKFQKWSTYEWIFYSIVQLSKRERVEC